MLLYSMAGKQDIDFTYTTLDRIFRLSIGETADFSAAMYNGNFSMSLQEAQKAKHEFIERELNIKKGDRVLDMGSGWGPFLKFISAKGVKVIGLTLSDGQYNACRKNGFEVYIKDVRRVQPEDYGIFDAVVSVGAFEHFCSIEEYKAGKQEEVYTDFFRTVSRILPPGGRFYLQTMSFEKNMIPLEKIDINADKNSDSYLLALCRQHLPGSWLPYGSEMITKCAAPFFNLINISSGRLDYIETIRVWRKMLRKFSFEKYALYLKFFFDSLKGNELKHLVQVFKVSPLMVCMEREIMGHYRIVFEKKT
jgi:cyclopropane-fatty-acyl-phospholipid synthase